MGCEILFRRVAIVVHVRVHRHHHRLAIDHHRGGGGARRSRGGTRRIDGGDRIGEVETLSRPDRAGVEILAHGGHHGIGVGRGNADILERAGQGIARIQRHRAAFHARTGIGIIRIVAGILRLAGADQLHEQRVRQERTARCHQRMADRHHPDRHPGDGARYQCGQRRRYQRPAAVGGGHGGAGAVQAAAQAGGERRKAGEVADFAAVETQSGSLCR